MSPYSHDVGLADFNEIVLDASYRTPVLVDFWAAWCQPCRVLKPILEKLAAEYQGRFVLAKVDSDANQELAARYGVRGIPAVKAFVDGQLVDEFTGALPEAQVREFIEGLMPSPAEPLHQEALVAADGGDFDAARTLLTQARELDPRNEAVGLDYTELCIRSGHLDAAREALDVWRAPARDRARIDALDAQLQLAAAGSGDIATLRARIAADGDDLAARLEIANALALAGDYRAAFEQLIEIVRRDRRWNDDAGRKTMLTLFNLLAGRAEFDDLVREFRLALARTLN